MYVLLLGLICFLDGPNPIYTRSLTFYLFIMYEYTKCVIHQSAISLPDRCGEMNRECVRL